MSCCFNLHRVEKLKVEYLPVHELTGHFVSFSELSIFTSVFPFLINFNDHMFVCERAGEREGKNGNGGDANLHCHAWCKSFGIVRVCVFTFCL